MATKSVTHSSASISSVKRFLQKPEELIVRRYHIYIIGLYRWWHKTASLATWIMQQWSKKVSAESQMLELANTKFRESSLILGWNVCSESKSWGARDPVAATNWCILIKLRGYHICWSFSVIERSAHPVVVKKKIRYLTSSRLEMIIPLLRQCFVSTVPFDEHGEKCDIGNVKIGLVKPKSKHLFINSKNSVNSPEMFFFFFLRWKQNTMLISAN